MDVGRPVQRGVNPRRDLKGSQITQKYYNIIFRKLDVAIDSVLNLSSFEV